MSAPARTEKKMDCTYCPIRERAICAYCEPAELALLNQAKSYQVYEKGKEILSASRPGDFVGTIVSGVVALSKTQPDGRKQVMGLQFPSYFLGGAFRPRAACDAVAATDVLVCRFDKRSFEQFLADTPNLRDRLLDLTLDELDAMRDWMSILGLKTAREKVSAFLQMIARRSAGQKCSAGQACAAHVAVDLPISRGEIGESLGLTIETVSRQLSKLKVEKVIGFENSRQFTVLDPEALRDAAGEVDDPDAEAAWS